MRSFSGLYFFLRIVPYLIRSIMPLLNGDALIQCFFVGTGFFVTALVMTVAKPYHKAYMNHVDTIVLLLLALLCYMVLAGSYVLQIAKILLAAPILIFILINAGRMFRFIIKHLLKYTYLSIFKEKCITLVKAVFLSKRSAMDVKTATQPLIQPTCSVIKYGINDVTCNDC